jgi:hypothetical protein
MSYYSQSTATTEGTINASVLRETRALQEESLQALHRIRCKTSESKALGTETLNELNEQTTRLESTEAKTIELKSNLDKAGKLQDRFAKITWQFGNRRKAKKELAREEKAEANKQIAPPTFKRRGARPKKQPTPADQQESENLVAEERNDTVWSNRKQIFSNDDDDDTSLNKPIKKKKKTKTTNAAKKEPIKKKKKKKTKTTRKLPKDEEAATVPLSEEDQRVLRDIHDTDALIDEGINVMGDEVAQLLALSLSMGEVASHQNGKLETIDTNLETTSAQTNLLNKRVKLFTTTRRGRKKE